MNWSIDFGMVKARLILIIIRSHRETYKYNQIQIVAGGQLFHHHSSATVISCSIGQEMELDHLLQVVVAHRLWLSSE